MSVWRSTLKLQLALVVGLSGALLVVQPGLAEGKGRDAGTRGHGDAGMLKNFTASPRHPFTASSNAIPRIRDLKRPATTVKDWMAQVEAATVRITNVKLERTDAGLEITLETAEGKPLQVDATKFRTEGSSLIADIPNAVLALTDNQPFATENPTADVASVRVAQQDSNSIRVSVTGKNALPKTEVTLKAGGLAYSLNPEAEEPDEEIVVTGERSGYRVPNTSVGTRTDAPLRDIPQSIQVVPQQVIRDQQVNRVEDALRNVPGVTLRNPNYDLNTTLIIRGFPSFGIGNFLRNGLQAPVQERGLELSNIERVEVLKGPASVLFGQGTPGGTVNLVTKQPLRAPFYAIDATIGSYDFYRGAVDLSGPLNDSRTVLYRLNTSYRNSDSFIDFLGGEHFFIAPVLSLAFSDRTTLTLEGEYTDSFYGYTQGLPAIGTVLDNPNGKIPRNRNSSGPDTGTSVNVGRVGYALEHKFSNNWSLRNAFRAAFSNFEGTGFANSRLLSNNRTLNRSFFDQRNNDEGYALTADLTGKFSTGSIQHQLLFGADLSKFDTNFLSRNTAGAPIDLFNPVYDQRVSSPITTEFINSQEKLGIYVQDQVTLAENLKLLLGVRFDTFDQTNRVVSATGETKSSASDSAFSPRIGVVYQPIPPISLYASYSRSFNPIIGTAFDGTQFQPERGTQYEVGVKADLSNRLSATLAFYDLSRSNVLTADTNNPGFSIQTGKQRSKGIELSVAGEIAPGWNIIAGYAYTDARVEEDNTFRVGNFLNNVPKNSFNLWTTYQLQKGPLQGFGVGLGFFYVADRQGDLANTFEVPSYFRTDASIFYKRGQFRVQVNFKNLFDVDYFESTFGRLSVSPGDPFTVQGTISWQF